ncbi:hypothetical protein OIU76_015596 [Salix suchowensis]|nr:hypothetical protein OIU76_015596 [Salix suchowensis]
MERTSSDSKMKQEEDVQAGVEIWKYVFGFTGMVVVKCATELEIAEAIENHEGPMALSDLSSTVGCVPFSIDRIVRFLVHRHFFKEEPIIQGTTGKERASGEWDCVLKEAGFSSYNIKPIRAVQSVIEAFP